MASEIEVKFLVASPAWKAQAVSPRALRQGYLAVTAKLEIRVRADENAGWITIKSTETGRRRSEHEYSIPLPEANDLLDMCPEASLSKTRWLLHDGGNTWEIDEYNGRLAHLVVAELELTDEDSAFERPDWLGTEVTHDPRFRNKSLATAETAPGIAVEEANAAPRNTRTHDPENLN